MLCGLATSAFPDTQRSPEPGSPLSQHTALYGKPVALLQSGDEVLGTSSLFAQWPPGGRGGHLTGRGKELRMANAPRSGSVGRVATCSPVITALCCSYSGGHRHPRSVNPLCPPKRGATMQWLPDLPSASAGDSMWTSGPWQPVSSHHLSLCPACPTPVYGHNLIKR